jgi:hypothetical protein
VEDLEGCSGAGLYDSVANVENTCALHAAMHAHARTRGRRMPPPSQMHSFHARAGTRRPTEPWCADRPDTIARAVSQVSTRGRTQRDRDRLGPFCLPGYLGTSSPAKAPERIAIVSARGGPRLLTEAIPRKSPEL